MAAGVVRAAASNGGGGAGHGVEGGGSKATYMSDQDAVPEGLGDAPLVGVPTGSAMEVEEADQVSVAGTRYAVQWGLGPTVVPNPESLKRKQVCC